MTTTTDLPVRPHIVQDGTNLTCTVCGDGIDIDTTASIADAAEQVAEFIGEHALGECCPHCRGMHVAVQWRPYGGREFTCPCVATLRTGVEPDWSDL